MGNGIFANLTERTDMGNIYIAKPVQIEAYQYPFSEKDMDIMTYEYWNGLAKVINPPFKWPGVLHGITTFEGYKPIEDGDWIIRGLIGEYYPCKDEVFKAKYEPLNFKENNCWQVVVPDSED